MFIKIAVSAPALVLGNCSANADAIIHDIDLAAENGASVLLTPFMSITGSTCGDLAKMPFMLKEASDALVRIAKYTENLNLSVIVGLPMRLGGDVQAVTAVIGSGKVLSLIPEKFTAREMVSLFGYDVPVGKNVFESDELCFAVCRGTPSFNIQSAPLLLCVGSEPLTAGSHCRLLRQLGAVSENRRCGIVYINPSEGESGGDNIFAGNGAAFDDGEEILNIKPFETGVRFAEFDTEALSFICRCTDDIAPISVKATWYDTISVRKYPAAPFMPADLDTYCDEIISVQAHALKRRLLHTHSKSAIIGVSGGLDSTLALLALVDAADLMGVSRKFVNAVTMPCFGTTTRTRSNAEKLCTLLGTSFETIDIKAAVDRHFIDIGHPDGLYNVTYENSQARERTQILMDLANARNGLVIGTGDLSELALGWATFNGDHMSMYGVNASIPKTLMRAIVRRKAEIYGGEIREVLLDIIGTPVSPELLPPATAASSGQMTEDIVGPYELHDFFIWHFIKRGSSPAVIKQLALNAFEGRYDEKTIDFWLTTFMRRFTYQQFKRSCMPEGIDATGLSLSPRGRWHMPSDLPAPIK